MASQEATQSDNQPPIPCVKHSKRAMLRSIVGRPDAGHGLAGERAVVGGWVNSFDVAAKRTELASPPRNSTAESTSLTCTEVLMSRVPLIRCIARLIAGSVSAETAEKKAADGMALLRINDGSCASNLQIVVDSSLCPLEQVTVIGASVLVEGKVEQVQTRGQCAVELRVEKILHIGAVVSEKYPAARLSLELIRHYPLLAARTTVLATTARLRSTLMYAMHAFFQNQGFFHVNMPIITTTMGDCSKTFHVTCLLSKSDDSKMISSSKQSQDAITSKMVRAAIKEKSRQIEELKRSDSNKEALVAAEQDLQKANELAQQLEQQEMSSSQAEKPDFSKDFFGRPAYLSPYHGLHLETYACALCSVYTWGAVFQAESSEGGKRLVERWNADAELAFAELEDAISCSEDCLKSVCSSGMKDCSDDLKFLSSEVDHEAYDRIRSAVSSPWPRISYTEAVEKLAQATDRSFETKAEWGMPLSREQQNYLAHDSYKMPIIIYDYPKEQKPFYARVKEDGKTVSAFDIIMPKVGVVASGAQKEERMDFLTSRMQEFGLPQEQLEWYLDTRRHGTVKHSGFSIDFEQLVMFVTGLRDVRYAIAFPRTRGDARC